MLLALKALKLIRIRSEIFLPSVVVVVVVVVVVASLQLQLQLQLRAHNRTWWKNNQRDL